MPKRKNLVVLLVEDHPSTLLLYEELIKRSFGGETETLSATTIERAAELFQARRKELSVVVMDGNLCRGRTLDTLPLIAMMRECSPRLPIIAASYFKEHREQMMCEGCHYELERKEDLPKVLTDALIGS